MKQAKIQQYFTNRKNRKIELQKKESLKHRINLRDNNNVRFYDYSIAVSLPPYMDENTVAKSILENLSSYASYKVMESSVVQKKIVILIPLVLQDNQPEILNTVADTNNRMIVLEERLNDSVYTLKLN